MKKQDQRPTRDMAISGWYLKNQMKLRGVTQQALADKIGSSRTLISQWWGMAEIPEWTLRRIDPAFGGTAWRQGPEIYTASGKSVSLPDRVRDGPPSPRDYGAVMAEMDKRWTDCVKRIEAHAQQMSSIERSVRGVEKELRELRLFRVFRKRRVMGKAERKR